MNQSKDKLQVLGVEFNKQLNELEIFNDKDYHQLSLHRNLELIISLLNSK